MTDTILVRLRELDEKMTRLLDGPIGIVSEVQVIKNKLAPLNEFESRMTKAEEMLKQHEEVILQVRSLPWKIISGVFVGVIVCALTGYFGSQLGLASRLDQNDKNMTKIIELLNKK